jgi:exonuclease VII large subunit
VANECHITPTACGVAVADRALAFWSGVAHASRSIAEGAVELVDAEIVRHHDLRLSLEGAVRRCVREHERSLRHAKGRLLVAPGSTLARATESVGQRRSRLVPAATARLVTVAAEIDGRRRLLGAYDPMRTLARGWTLTRDESGKIIRSVAEVSNGAMISTQMFDGQVTSTVTGTTGGAQGT